MLNMLKQIKYFFLFLCCAFFTQLLQKSIETFFHIEIVKPCVWMFLRSSLIQLYISINCLSCSIENVHVSSCFCALIVVFPFIEKLSQITSLLLWTLFIWSSVLRVLFLNTQRASTVRLNCVFRCFFQRCVLTLFLCIESFIPSSHQLLLWPDTHWHLLRKASPIEITNKLDSN